MSYVSLVFLLTVCGSLCQAKNCLDFSKTGYCSSIKKETLSNSPVSSSASEELCITETQVPITERMVLYSPLCLKFLSTRDLNVSSCHGVLNGEA